MLADGQEAPDIRNLVAQEIIFPPQCSLRISSGRLHIPSPWPLFASCAVTLHVSVLQFEGVNYEAVVRDHAAVMAAKWLAGRLPLLPGCMSLLHRRDLISSQNLPNIWTFC